MPAGRRFPRAATAASAAAVLVALAAGCAGPRPGPARAEEPPLPYPPSARARLMRILLEEWRDWGSQVVDLRGEATGAAPGPAPASDRPAPAETRPENFPRVLAYWRAVDDDEGAVARNRPLYRAALEGRAEGAALWQQPFWSAAFVSFVMRAAGVDRAEFPPAPAHATYVDAMIDTALRHPATAPFVPHGPAERAPRPGDLVCADRGGGADPIADWRRRLAEAGRYRPMHCDVVVATGPGVVEAIGGNVRDAVTLTRFAADASGYLLPRPPGAPVWFAVFENRLGCLPPWSPPLSPPWSPSGGPPCPAPPIDPGSPAS